MRKYLILAVLAVFVAALSPVAALAGQNKLTVCHLEGNDTFHLIEVAEPAYYNALIAHGDLLPGEAVPGMPGYVFDDTCEPIEALSVSAHIEWQNSIGNVTADDRGLTYDFAGTVYTYPPFLYPQEYWGIYNLYLPYGEVFPRVFVDLEGPATATLTVAFDVFMINLDGSTSAAVPAGSFQQTFTADSAGAVVTPAGAATYECFDDWTPECYDILVGGFAVPDSITSVLFLGVAQVFEGSDATGLPLASAEAIAAFGSTVIPE